MAADPVRYYRSWFVAETGWRNIERTYGDDLDLVTAWIPSLFGSAKAADSDHRTVGQLLDPTLCESCELPNGANRVVPVSRGFGSVGWRRGLWAAAWPDIEVARELPAVHARQVERNAANDWKSFELDPDLWAMITEIAAWSRANDVTLVFFIPPTIPEMQRRIADFGHARLNHAFRVRLAQLAPVIDLDFDSPLTRDIGPLQGRLSLRLEIRPGHRRRTGDSWSAPVRRHGPGAKETPRRDLSAREGRRDRPSRRRHGDHERRKELPSLEVSNG